MRQGHASGNTMLRTLFKEPGQVMILVYNIKIE